MSQLALASLLLGLAVAADRPSIVFILTDDREREPSIQRTRSTAASSDPDDDSLTHADLVAAR